MAFSYVGDSVAAVLTVGVLNDAIVIAQQKTDEVDVIVGQALALTNNAPQISGTPDVSVGLNLPTPPNINFDPNQALALYQDNASEITQLLANGFTTYITNYFPLGTELNDAIAWVKRALTTGGSGINVGVENAMWERNRSRILRESDRITDEVVTSWAAKGYSLPPGAMQYQVHQTVREAQNKVGEASTERAQLAFQAELENARLAVGQAIELRRAAITTALDYIRALALGPQLGSQLAATLLDAQAKVASTSSEFYRAQVAAAELPLRIATTNAELIQRTNEANQKALLDTLQQRVNATMAAAQALATQAAAMLNGFQARVGVDGNESL